VSNQQGFRSLSTFKKELHRLKSLFATVPFEGYLLDQNYTELIENTIREVNGEEYLQHWIELKNGTPLRQVKSSKPPCTTCNQFIFESQIRDYDGDAGKKRAILDILDSSKPQYAKAIAESLLSLPVDNLPQKVKDLFQQIITGT
jgi:putative ATP-dependent endonuclease of OLD family